MGERTLEIGGIYRHFKNKLYQIKCIAYHSETKEKMVVYQALYGDFSVYVRPYNMFISEVDHQKYPEVHQKYRFEKVLLDAAGNDTAAAPVDAATAFSAQKAQPVLKEIPATPPVEKRPGEDSADPRLLRFLDAETYQAKLDTLTALKSTLDHPLIDAMAASLDVEVPEGPVESRYQSLRKCILAHTRYECNRLR